MRRGNVDGWFVVAGLLIRKPRVQVLLALLRQLSGRFLERPEPIFSVMLVRRCTKIWI